MISSTYYSTLEMGRNFCNGLHTAAVGAQRWLSRAFSLEFPSIIATETWTVVCRVLPLAVEWGIKRVITREITLLRELSLSAGGTTITARLYLHGALPAEGRSVVRSAVYLHGDHSHPYTMLHLIKAAGRSRLRVALYSIHMPRIHDNSTFQLHARLFQHLLYVIRTPTIGEECRNIVGLGHSKGAILLAHHLFTSPSPPISRVCAIAARLHIPPGDQSCALALRPIVRTLEIAIEAHPQRRLRQIIPKDDWNAPRAAMAVRPASSYLVPGMHLSGLFAEETVHQCTAFVLDGAFP